MQCPVPKCNAEPTSKSALYRHCGMEHADRRWQCEAGNCKSSRAGHVFKSIRVWLEHMVDFHNCNSAPNSEEGKRKWGQVPEMQSIETEADTAVKEYGTESKEYVD